MASKPSGPDLGALRDAPTTGVARVVLDAIKLGYTPGHPDWSNLGPARPETGPLEEGPPRLESLEIGLEDHAYGSPAGQAALRERIAEHYNRTFRGDRASKYGPQNIAVGPGVRPSIARALAALDAVPIGYTCPDCAFFEDLVEPHIARLTPVPIRTDPADGFQLRLDAVEKIVRDGGLGALLLSNPNNPTGTLVGGKRLARLVRMAREQHCTLLLDESYAPFSCEAEGAPLERPPSAAEFVEDTDRDPVLIFDGVSMSQRYPGWRLGWAVGPAAMVEQLARIGAALDGGASRLAQAAALRVLDPERVTLEYASASAHFAKKRALALKRLTDMGVRFEDTARSTFFLWGDISGLPEPWDDAQTLYKKALQQRVLTVPGEAFDVDPGRRRRGPSPYRSRLRISCGPSLDNLRMGLDRLAKVLRES